jgi:eukaryotic translation initiation factor 2C
MAVISAERVLPARLNMQLVQQLQDVVAPDVFTPPAVYDGRKNIFACRELPLGPTHSKEVRRISDFFGIDLLSP